MAGERWATEESRKINARVVIEGRLVACSPLHLGGDGDGGEGVDLPLLRDAVDGSPLLPGASLAGALRGYLRARLLGDRAPKQPPSWERGSIVTRLFGGQGVDLDKNGERMFWAAESVVVIDDARGALPAGGGVELRNGVRLDAASRTAAEGALFNQELWPAGTHFPLRVEVALGEGGDVAALLGALATALEGLRPAVDGIMLGARKRRGYGRVAVDAWAVRRYDLTTPAGLLDWLEHGHEPPVARPGGQDIAALLEGAPLGDNRWAFTATVTCALQGSLLIRSGYGADDMGPDMVHLHSRQANGDGSRRPVLSGASLAGALRSRAQRIANTLYPRDRASEAKTLIDGMFGPLHPEAAPGRRMPGLWASRLTVTEQVVEGARTDLVQNRVAIDRFTGGSYPGALFDEQPAFATPDTTITFGLRLVSSRDDEATEAEVGLLLLVLKDLWTADLPLGGESSVGRGRLRGRKATIQLPGRDGDITIAARGGDGAIEVGETEALEACVRALHRRVQGERSV